jgi:O-antigen ligase
MPNHLKALIVILVLATVVFAFARAPSCAVAITAGDFKRRRNVWFAVTLAAFLAHNFWVYIIVTAALLLFALPREQNKLAMYFFLLFAVPPIQAEITGLGIIKHFFAIDYFRLLSLAVLLPAYLLVRKQPEVIRFGRLLPDKFILGYFILNFVLMLAASTFTNTLRQAVFYNFIDYFLPYYVASRSMKSLQDFRDALMSFVVAVLVMSAIGAFEMVTHWLLYAAVGNALGIQWEWGTYLERTNTALRAQASTGHAIALGYVMAVAFGFFFYLKKSVSNATVWNWGLAALVVGLISTLSRGPWVGAAAMLLIFVATGPAPLRGIVKMGVFGVFALPFLLATPLGEKFIALLPFVGSIEQGTLTYRQRLFEIGVSVIMQNPFFGAYTFFLSEEAQELRQGGGANGLIDLGNTYLAIGLGNGLVGLSLFTGVFVAVGVGIFNGMRKLADRNSETYLLGQVLLSVLIGILFMIFTVSSSLVIPMIYWSVAGLGIAYLRILALAKAPSNAPEAALGRAGFQPMAIRSR